MLYYVNDIYHRESIYRILITEYIITDDSSKHCDVYHTAELSDTDKTKMIVMPVNEFWTQFNPYFSGEFM